eukprot:759211-Hanusia_phi.AAC.2
MCTPYQQEEEEHNQDRSSEQRRGQGEIGTWKTNFESIPCKGVREEAGACSRLDGQDAFGPIDVLSLLLEQRATRTSAAAAPPHFT